MRHRWLLHIVPDQCGQYRIDINTTPMVLTLIPHPFIKTRAINSKIHWLLRIPIFERSCCVAGCDATVYPFIGVGPILCFLRIAVFYVGGEQVCESQVEGVSLFLVRSQVCSHVGHYEVLTIWFRTVRMKIAFSLSHHIVRRLPVHM